jgi:two-component system, LytTR family, sensor histidine kinase AlgZ
LHPLLARPSSLTAYLLFWAGLSCVPALLLGSSSVSGALLLAVLCTVAFAVATLPTFYLCRTLPLQPNQARRLLSVHVVAATLSALAYVIGARLVAETLALLPAWRALPAEVGDAEGALLGIGALFYLLVATSHYVLAELEARRDAGERAAELALTAERANLSALRAQVHPHFLFNSLNTVSALIGYDSQKAREACLLLAEYLRGTLNAQEQSLVSLEKEWSLCERYLKVEALRFGERLHVDVAIAEPASACLVPSLLLQPLVENAMTHGIAKSEAPRPLQVRAERRGDRLSIELENGVEPASLPREGGLGLANVRARLAGHYASDASLRIERDTERFLVRLDLPARSAEARGAP